MALSLVSDYHTKYRNELDTESDPIHPSGTGPPLLPGNASIEDNLQNEDHLDAFTHRHSFRESEEEKNDAYAIRVESRLPNSRIR